ncbi:MAG TPA: twin-arginine translocation signal domain-containing protein [Verrucomicrobiae bacterium]|jgi:DNA-binding beta-propeller fold protein YncE|nr:twin-arginine translocation signal domain-containing protein [Verrucomicrobiae bacterium]
MKTKDYLFPHRLTRRDFLKMAGAASAALVVPGCATSSAEKNSGVRIGSGYHTYELVDDWGKLPEGMTYGFGCGIVVDGHDRVFVTSRAPSHTVSIFDRHGKLLETWGDDFAEKVGLTQAQVAKTAHGLYWSREGSQEYLYWTENVNSTKKPNYGGRVYKTDLHGKVLYTIGNVEKEGSASQKFDWTNPTDVAVAPNGDIYVVDGYGSQRVSHFDKNFTHIKTIGGPGKEHGQFNTCHGVWINTLQPEPEVYIADRANGRIEVYSLALDYRRTVLEGDVRNPCCFFQHKDKIYIPDLDSRVTVMDAHDKVAAQLGDGKGDKNNETNPAVFAKPHALNVDSRGDLYVIEWIASGRPRKFKHVPQASA